jgi:integrase
LEDGNGHSQNMRMGCLLKDAVVLNFDLFAQSVIASLPVREKTRGNYRSMYRCHIQAELGAMHLEDIDRSMVQELIIKLPAQTSLMTLAVMKSIFREAVARGVIELSPAKGVVCRSLNVAPRKFLTWEQVRDGDFGKYHREIKFLALHGLRWGEAVVLTEDDVRVGRIYVNKSIHGATKTQAGNRVVPLVGEFVQIPKSPKTLKKVLDPYGVHIHSLRHTYAYLLKTQGIHVTTAQKLMGHSDPKVTMKIYTQVLDDEIDKTGAILARIS